MGGEGGRGKRNYANRCCRLAAFPRTNSFGADLVSGVLAACIDVIGIPKRVLTSPDLAAYVMAEGDDGDEGGRAEARTPRNVFFHRVTCVCVIDLPPSVFRKEDKTTARNAAEAKTVTKWTRSVLQRALK